MQPTSFICTIANHPQMDGQVERMNELLEEYLRNYVIANQWNWLKLLDMTHAILLQSSSIFYGQIQSIWIGY